MTIQKIISSILQTTTIIAALLYYFGWIYTYHYFDNFSVSLSQISISTNECFINGFGVIKYNNFYFFLIIAVFIVIINFSLFFLKKFREKFSFNNEVISSSITDKNKCLSSESGQLPSKNTFIGPIIIAFIMLSIFIIIGHKLSIKTANAHFDEQLYSGFSSYYRISIYFSPIVLKEQNVLRKFSKGCYKLLLQSKNNLFVFLSRQNNSNVKKVIIHVIPLKSIDYYSIIPLHSNCSDSDLFSKLKISQ